MLSLFTGHFLPKTTLLHKTSDYRAEDYPNLNSAYHTDCNKSDAICGMQFV